MRVLNVIASMDPECGGPSEGVRQLTRALIGLGHHVDIVCIDPPTAPWLEESGSMIYALGPSYLGTFAFGPRLLAWLKVHAKEFDCLIVHGLWEYPGLATWMLLKRGLPPYFLYPHGQLDPIFRRLFPIKHIKKSVYWQIFARRILRDARVVFFTSEEEFRGSQSSFSPFEGRGVVVSFGTNGPVGDPEAQRNRFFESFPDLIDKHLLLFLGRIHPKKGCDLAIQAFAEVVSAHPNLRLVMAGPDTVHWTSELRRRAIALGIDNRIVWTGTLSTDLKWGAFHSANAFILPSHQENFGSAVVEALSCSLPVLLSNKVNIWSEIVSSGAGFTDEDSLEGTITMLRQWLACSFDEQLEMRKRAFACYSSRFTMNRVVNVLVQTMIEHGMTV